MAANKRKSVQDLGAGCDRRHIYFEGGNGGGRDQGQVGGVSRSKTFYDVSRSVEKH